MSTGLVTRCPECATAFRVQPDQLSARGGRVRCGKCSSVFDGLANLVQEAPPAPIEPSPQIGLFDPRGRPTAEASTRQAEREAPGSATTMRADAASAVDGAQMDDAALPEFLEERPERPPFRVVWGFLSLLAALALAAQALLLYRTEVAVLFPETRPHLEIACGMLDCELHLPRRAELLSIESSDLQADARRANVLVLNAVVRNRAPFPQEYPSLELTLTDERDEAVVRRVLNPADYLADRRGVARGIPAGGEEALRLYFEAAKVRATGYRLYLFFP